MRILISFILLITTVANATTYHMAVDGSNDTGEDEAHGFTTPNSALAYIMTDNSNDLTGGHTITVHGGNYYLTSTLALTSVNSGGSGTPVVWEAHGAEVVKWSGAIEITGDKFGGGGNVKSVDLSAFSYISGARVVTLNGTLMEWCREPDRNYSDDRAGFHTAETNGATNTLKYRSGAFDASSWTDITDGFLQCYTGENFKNYFRPIYSIATDSTRLITFAGMPEAYTVEINDRYVLVNIPEICDASKEWYWDPSGEILYLYPPEALDGGDLICMAQLTNVMTMVNCDYHTFNDIVFSETIGDVITLSLCDYVIFDGCTIKNSFSIGIFIDDCTELDITDCTINDHGREGIKLKDGGVIPTQKDQEMTPNEIDITGCTFDYTEYNISEYGGMIYIEDCVGVDIQYNTFSNGPRCAIFISGINHTVKYNRISNIGRWTEDTAALHMRGRKWTSLGTEISHNYIDANDAGYGHLDTSPYTVGNKAGYGIYLDDAQSGVTIHHNCILYAPEGNIFIHAGRDNTITNNILIRADSLQQVIFNTVNYWSWSNPAIFTDLANCVTSDGYYVYGDWTTAFPKIADVAAIAAEYDPDSSTPRNLLFAGNLFKRNHIIYPNIDTNYMRATDINYDNSSFDDNFIYSGSSDNLNINHKADAVYGDGYWDWNTWTDTEGINFDTSSVLINDIVNPLFMNEYTLFWNFTASPNEIDLEGATYIDGNETTVTSLTLPAWSGVVLYQEEPPSSDLTDCRWYFTVTIPAAQVGTGGVTNYTVLLTEDNIPSAVVDSGGSAPSQANGGDLRVTSNADQYVSTQYACWPALWGHDASPCELYFGPVTLSDSVDNVFRVYYNTAAASTQPAEDASYGKDTVFHSGQKAFYIFDEDPEADGAALIDHTSNANNGTPNGTMLTADEVTGKVHNGWDFDGGDDFVDCGTDSSLLSEVFTLRAWINVNTTSNDQYFVSFNTVAAALHGPSVAITTDNKPYWKGHVTNGTVLFEADYVDDTMMHFVLINPNASSVDDSTCYLNGALVADDTVSDAAVLSFATLLIGRRPTTLFTDGVIDHLGLWSSGLSAAWVTTDYNNSNDPATFATEGTPTEVSGGVPGTIKQGIIIMMSDMM